MANTFVENMLREDDMLRENQTQIYLTNIFQRLYNQAGKLREERKYLGKVLIGIPKVDGEIQRKKGMLNFVIASDEIYAYTLSGRMKNRDDEIPKFIMTHIGI